MVTYWNVSWMINLISWNNAFCQLGNFLSLEFWGLMAWRYNIISLIFFAFHLLIDKKILYFHSMYVTREGWCQMWVWQVIIMRWTYCLINNTNNICTHVICCEPPFPVNHKKSKLDKNFIAYKLVEVKFQLCKYMI